ncbi:MAG TPA: hypothetical protein VFC28_04740 [Opitutaceae bacterium]|nr:hypothetical protein [Opitutaceae bacterium]
MKPHSLVAILLSTSAWPALSAGAADPIPPGWFAWPYVEAQPGSALDTSGLNEKPAGLHGAVVVRNGQFVTSGDGQRIRFWGCNLASDEAFVDAATADRLARRLAQGGINIARLHHLDNSWSVDSGGSLWKPGTPDRIHIDPAQLDKLHRLVAALKAQGIYSNVNLKVSRTLTEADGFPASIAEAPGFQKRLDYFQRRIIDLQKDYARQLLTAKNPYTGFSLAEDPAVAVIEINNENSLLGLRTREIGAGLELLPEPFRAELTARWNGWLARRYADDRALAAAWAKDATPPGESPLSPGSRWFADAQPGDEVIVTSRDPGAVHLEGKPGDGVRWRSAAYLDQLRLIEGATYTLTFAARADRARPIEVAVGRDEAGWRTDKWRTVGLRTTLALTPEWQPFRLVFTTHSIVDVASRLSVIAGHAPGEIWLKELHLESGSAIAGLRAGESPRHGSVPIPTDATPAQWNDYLSFLLDTEQSYVAEMRAYLRDTLHVRAPIVCTQANYGGIAGLVREKPSDYIDAHYYWQHPDFAGVNGAWDPANYTINNTPQLAEFSARWFGEIGGIALLRVSGKPFSVTEVDHPAPSDYAAEMYPVLATFAGLQDWDALYPFDFRALGAAQDDGAIRSFFDQNHHPAKWGFGPFATRVFRHGLVPPPASRRELFVSAPFWREANHVDVLWLKLQGAQDLGFLTDRLSVNENLLGADQPSHVEHHGESRVTAVRMVQTKRGPAYLAAVAPAAAIVGYIGGSSLTAGDLAVVCGDFGLNFAAIGAVALDERPLSVSTRVLVTLAARAENQGTKWNAARTSVGDAWGKGGPPIAERVPAIVRLKTSGPRRVTALAPDGSAAGEIAATWTDGWLSFSTREGPATLHYEIHDR